MLKKAAIRTGGLAQVAGDVRRPPAARFCPTGGITEATAPAYLALSNVGLRRRLLAHPADLLAAGAWAGVTDLAAR